MSAVYSYKIFDHKSPTTQELAIVDGELMVILLQFTLAINEDGTFMFGTPLVFHIICEWLLDGCWRTDVQIRRYVTKKFSSL